MADITWEPLIEAALEVRGRAYSPYSGYAVGAALLGRDGQIYAGCNVENASYGLTMCAERNAIFQAVAKGCKRITAIAIVADGNAMPYPCGACRQVMSEFCDPDCEVLVAPLQNLDSYDQSSFGTLLPKTFTLLPDKEDE